MNFSFKTTSYKQSKNMGNISDCCAGREYNEEDVDVNPRPHTVYEHYSQDIQQEEITKHFHQFLTGELTSTKFGFDLLIQMSLLQKYIDKGKYQIVCSVKNKLYYVLSNKELVCTITVPEV